MADANMSKASYYPDYINRILTLAGSIRDFHAFRENLPLAPIPPASNTLYGWQLNALADLATGATTLWYQQARTVINLIRGVHNTNPLWVIDPIEDPEPDPIDGYYYVSSALVYTNESHPTTMSVMSTMVPGSLSGKSLGKVLLPGPLPTPKGLPLPYPIPKPPIKPRPPRPWPPWPPPPPLPPPPIYWCPPAEEDYTYIYGYYWILQGYASDRSFDKLELEYFGYHFMEMIKRCYEMYRFHLDEATVKSFCLTQETLLRTILQHK